MRTIPQYVCGVIPLHMLAGAAGQTGDRGRDARATIEHMREMATGRTRTLIEATTPAARVAPSPRKRLHVYDAEGRFRRGRIVRNSRRGTDDVVANEAWETVGATDDFLARVVGRNSIDGRGMRLDVTVHYGTRFANTMWNGRQIVCGDGDGRIFTRFTRSLDAIAHEMMHGVTQCSACLAYHGQSGALNEHLADALGMMVKQYVLGQTAEQSDWLIGAELLGPDVRGKAVRSMAAPGTAYDDPILGRDPQPRHMRDYVETDADNGGVHINSGILNHAFYLAAKALGGKTWEVLGQIWYAALTERLRPEARFDDFTRATVDIAGERSGNGGRVQHAIAEAWAAVGLKAEPVPCTSARLRVRRPQPSGDSLSINDTTAATTPAPELEFKAGKDL